MKIFHTLYLITLVLLLGASTAAFATTPAATRSDPKTPAGTTVLIDHEAAADEQEDNAAASDEFSEEEPAEGEDEASDAAPASDKDDFVLMKVKGFELANKGNPKDAEAAVDLFQKYLSAHPDSGDAMIALAYAYMNQGKVQESFDLAEKGIKRDDKNYLGYYVKGMGYLGQGKGELATQTFTSADKKAKEENNILGQMYASLGLSIAALIASHPDECVKWANEAIMLTPAQVIMGKGVLASLNLNASDQSMLVTVYIAAVGLKAGVYVSNGKKTEGITLLENLSKAYPQDERVIKVLADIKKKE